MASTSAGVTPDPPDLAWVHRRMVAQKTRDTTPELALRRALHAAGHRYRVNVKVPGAPRRTIDIVFTRQKLAVMVDGCFWHGCPVHSVAPKHNAQWWAEKLARNVARDAETTALLEEAGWTVLRIWEHEDPASALAAVQAALTTPRTT
ncbi:very short patch repair endonuclease [Propionibacteriaceae bacterium Y1923]